MVRLKLAWIAYIETKGQQGIWCYTRKRRDGISDDKEEDTDHQPPTTNLQPPVTSNLQPSTINYRGNLFMGKKTPSKVRNPAIHSSMGHGASVEEAVSSWLS